MVKDYAKACSKYSCYWYEKGICGLTHTDLSRYYRCKKAQQYGTVSEYVHWKDKAGLRKKRKRDPLR